MNIQFNDIKSNWNEAKENLQPTSNSSTMWTIAAGHHKKAKNAHVINVLILSLTLVGLSAFFHFIAPMQEVLSHIGVGLMIGGLLIRIFIELLSHQKASKLDFSKSCSHATNQLKGFYQFRKRVQGQVTAIIFLTYSVAFYLLIPEFSRYLSQAFMWYITLSYIPIAITLIIIIRSGYRREINAYNAIQRILSSFEN